MSLTGFPLLLVGILASMGAFGLTIWCWERGGRWRPVARTLGVLSCEAVVLFTVGLAVNRALDLYPSWSALFNQDRAAPSAVVAAPGTRLDLWLRTKAAEGSRNGLVFQWHPGGAAAWHLPAAPVIYLPPRYFTATSARFPVVLVVAPAKAGPAQAGWDPHKVSLLIPLSDADANPAVIVLLRTDHPDETVLTRNVPRLLDGDLRTLARGWAVIGVGADAAVGLDALPLDPTRFWSAVAVADNPGGLPKPVARSRTYLDWQSTLAIVGPGSSGGPPSPTPGVVKGAPDQSRVQVVARVDARLPTALRWVYGLLPAPLTAPLTGPVAPSSSPSKKPGK